jgi:hypothetical protein
MKSSYSFIILSILLVQCGKNTPLEVDRSDNPPFYKNTAFELYEDLTSPKFPALKDKYQLDTVFKGETGELKRQLLLRNWIRTIVQISDFEPTYPGEDHAENILDEALKGQGYHCGHYMVVQNAVMNTYGYVTRCLGAGPGVKGGPDGHHGINEIWSNEFAKWYMSDAKYNHHFEKDGIPLSAIEIREEFLKNKVADVVLVKGPERTPIASDYVADKTGTMKEVKKERFAQTYTWIEWEKYNDRYTNWPESKAQSSVMNMYADDYFESHTWIWDGKPHWAYSKPAHMVRVSDRNAIEWTPNTIASDVKIQGDIARIALQSETPNLKSYQLRRNSHEWQNVDASFELQVNGAREELTFRTVNLAGVTGPEHKIVIARAQGNQQAISTN